MHANAPHKGFLVECSSPFMQFAQHLTALRRWVQAMPAWSVETRRAPSWHRRDARVHDHTTAAMHDMSTSLPPLSSRYFHRAIRFAKASLLLVGEGMQGVGFRHAPDWDVYKNDDWGRRREVLRRLVNSVGTWVVRRRAGKRLAAIQVKGLL